MSNNGRIIVIGGGGIGSYLVRDLADLRDLNLLIDSDGRSYNDIILYDDDEVEQKNISYQNFTEDDCFEPKAICLEDKYKITSNLKRVENLDDLELLPEDIIICCVDNAKFRKHLFEWQVNNPNFWIDLRSHSRMTAFYVRHPKNTLEVLLATLPVKEEQGSGSCQNAAELAAGKIQLSNRISAPEGAQLLLNHLRADSMAPSSVTMR